ncbi:MAG: membrane protein insertase YidC [Erysipelotrichaceae bacterium]|nr:membrane protein insertase YidC [Erysipelotrichaceae bacterium]MDD3923549.1 membrane protein insertase YidC [Erysipelotrichaceae bacterium]MDD4642771.1 membrane protein insertase YidC [Erysipelotrichaceae bacterium]
MKVFKKNKKYILLALLLIVLAGCTRVIDSEGKVLVEKIIYTSTTFSDMFSESWFTAIFIYPLAQIINLLTPSVGVVMAIVVATVFVNLITLPLTAKSTAGSQKMQLIQPEMDKITKKYEGKTDERSRLMQSQEITALYKKHDINVFSTLLGTFVTLPIIIAMWQAVQRSYAVTTGTFMGVDLQVSPMAGLKIGGTAILVYATFYVLMGVSQYISISLPKWIAKKKNEKDHKIKSYDKAPKKSGSTEMMTYSMLALILFMGATWPTAMSVYWLVNSAVNIIKTLLVQVQINKKGV